jgi:hypothetical protein
MIHGYVQSCGLWRSVGRKESDVSEEHLGVEGLEEEETRSRRWKYKAIKRYAASFNTFCGDYILNVISDNLAQPTDYASLELLTGDKIG